MTIDKLKEKAQALRALGLPAPRFIDALVLNKEAKAYRERMTSRGWRILKDEPTMKARQIILTNAKDEFFKTKRRK